MNWGCASLVRACTALLLALSGLVAAAAPKQTLVVAAFPAVDDIVRAAIPRWKLLHPDTEVRVLSRSFEDHHTVLMTALFTATNLPDVMVVEAGYLGRFAIDSRLSDLSQEPYLIKEQQARFAPFAFRQASTRSGAVLAAPADIGPGTMLYRADLLQTAGVSEEELTTSWETYFAAGVKIRAATGASLMPHARNVAEVLIRTDIADGESQYFDATGRALVESPRFVHAFELALRARQLDLDARQTSWSPTWFDAVRNGRIATVISGAWMLGHLATWVAPDSSGKWRAAQLPQDSWSAWGGTFYAIPKAAKNKKLAWEFIQFMTLNRESQTSAFKTQNAFPALLQAYSDPFFEQPIAYLGGQKARLLWRDAVAHIRPVGVHEFDFDVRIIVDSELNQVLDQGKDIHLALHDARLKIDRLAHNPLSRR